MGCWGNSELSYGRKLLPAIGSGRLVKEVKSPGPELPRRPWHHEGVTATNDNATYVYRQGEGERESSPPTPNLCSFPPIVA